MALDKKTYADLKNFSYYLYDVYSKSSDDKKIDLTNQVLAKYTDTEQKNIILNTLEFPYDMELNQIVQNISSEPLTLELLSSISEKFSIPMDLVQQKIQEYTKYYFENCAGEGLINSEILYKLSKEFVEKQDNLTENIQK